MSEPLDPKAHLTNIMESANRLGIELDEVEALQWLSAMAATEGAESISLDARSGIFGHKVVMLDFSQDDLAYFRKVGKLVEFFDEPGVVETALALSGSSAQSKIQTYPGDCDYFERINIKADSLEAAQKILARLIREKALSTLKGPTYQLIQVRFGSYPFEMVREERTMKAGSSIEWNASEIEAGQIQGTRSDGSPVILSWDEVSADPGWCKLDWIVADPVRNQLANASNMLDVTWEAPDGAIKPLDGYLDPYFQEVYLDATSVPIFAKLAQHVSANALDEYVSQLEGEVRKYVTRDINYGKAAKRMYNIFRLTGRVEEAAYVRELFDEPTTMLYQVWALIRTVEECFTEGAEIPKEVALNQTDQLILSVIRTLEGGEEEAVVKLLLRLKDGLSRSEAGKALNAQAEAARAEVINLVNNFFYEKLTALPSIQAYMDQIQKS